MPKDINKEVEEFKERNKKETEALIRDVFPVKVIELQQLYESLPLSKTQEINVELRIPVPDPILLSDCELMSKKRKLENDVNSFDIPGTKVMILPNGPVQNNTHLLTITEKVKPFIRELIDHANMLKMWITFLIPKIEDGNNFGVSIQEDIMAEARQVETEAATYLDQISRYFITRGKLISKVAKYPHIMDYRQSIKELDEKEYVSLRLVCCELRNHYASLYDLIMKNIDKIKKPRNINAESLY